MSQMSVTQAIELALNHQRKNELADAEGIYRQILFAFPDQADALHLLGVVLMQNGRYPEAEVLLHRAISSDPGQPTFRLHLGLLYQSTQRVPEAIQAYRDLIEQTPDFVEAYSQLGVALTLANQFEECVATLREALKRDPAHITAQANLAIALSRLGRSDEALWIIRTAIASAPHLPALYSTLASTLAQSGQIEAATAAAQQALTMDPNDPHAHLTLSNLSLSLNKPVEAQTHGQRAAQLLPGVATTHIAYAESLRRNRQPDTAIEVYREAIKRFPNDAELWNNLGNTLKDVGLLDEAIDVLRQAYAFSPRPAIESNRLYALLYHPTIDAEALFAAEKAYALHHETPLISSQRLHFNDASPDRRLRIGYISSEFRNHALGRYLLPLLANHDKNAVEIFCYSNVDHEDAVTFALRQYADKWQSVRQLHDAPLAESIRADKIDILIDLHQHMGGNFLPLFGRKPAPVQVGFAGYPGSTGLTSISYRLTDKYIEPALPLLPSEQPLPVLDTYWCFAPTLTISVNDLPAVQNDYITFGCLNNFCKINAPLLKLWARVMNAAKNSRLILLAPEGGSRARTLATLKLHGVTEDRVLFVPMQSAEAYFATYQRIDISLDPFPYNGHMTSMDSFYMGVPVVTRVGTSPVSRAGLSQLTNLGLPSLAAATDDAFVAVATALASDLPRLADMRRTLRSRMERSPLMDGKRFAQQIESAYRSAWQKWCVYQAENPV